MHQAFAPQSETLGPPQPAPDVQTLSIVRTRVLDPDPEFRHFAPSDANQNGKGLRDFLLTTDDEPHDPEQAFSRLRWGGQLVFASRDRREVAAQQERYADRGYTLSRGPAKVRGGWGLPLLSPRAHYLIARKTSLLPPREFSDRFTYQVRLERCDPQIETGSAALATDHWVVRKEVPTYEHVLARLKFKAPEVPDATLERRAKKFVEQIFPLFLTREAAMLKVIERDCPREFLHRFPRVIEAEKDDKGYVQRLVTTWLRNGGKPITQLEFAKQSAELLHILHDKVGIIHLDLRMDNMVVTEGGVGFVDFGSAVRENENIHGNAVLSTLFGELMRTSQIQRMMDRMATAGSLTSKVIREAHQQVDKSVDIFYLAVQFNQPTANPDLQDLILYDKYSPEAMELARLNNEILRPADPNNPRYHTAHDVLQEILRIEAKLKAGTTPRVVITSPPEPEPPPPEKPKVYIWS